MLRTAILLVVFAAPTVLRAAELALLPADVTLTGPHGRQQLLAVLEERGQVVGDRTASASFTTSNPAVVSVEGGDLRAVGDGEATITATVDTVPRVTTTDDMLPTGGIAIGISNGTAEFDNVIVTR